MCKPEADSASTQGKQQGPLGDVVRFSEYHKMFTFLIKEKHGCSPVHHQLRDGTPAPGPAERSHPKETSILRPLFLGLAAA